MTRYAWIVLAACVVASGCDDNPTAPSDAPLIFTAALSPANEVPPITNAESSARGAVQITMTPTRDSSGAITGATADFHIQMGGLPENTTYVGAHIHPGVAGVNGGVIVNTSLSAGTLPTIASGAATWDFRNITVSGANANAIASNPSGYYFNVHTFANPGGVARGQLSRIQ